MKLKTIDLCAGIGGIRRGFELAGGYRNIASAEIDEMACKTYEHLFHEDPRNDVTNEKFKKHLQTLHYDVLMAGFPCQAFSSVGLQHGFEDKTKGTIFFDIAKIIKMTRPKVVFLENVQNLLSHDKQATFKTIVDTLDRQLDYHIVGVTHDKDGIPQYKRSAFLRNSRDFGVPQNRPRVYIVAFSRAYFGQHISLLPEEAPTKRSRTPVFKSLADVLDKKVDSRFFLSSGYLDTLEKHIVTQHKKGYGFGYCIVNAPEIETPIANTLLATGGSGRERNLIYDPINGASCAGTSIKGKYSPINDKFIRTMTPNEWGRLQGFVGYAFVDKNGIDQFSFPEGIRNVQRFKQFGNSVTIPVIEEYALFIQQCCDTMYDAFSPIEKRLFSMYGNEFLLCSLISRELAYHLRKDTLNRCTRNGIRPKIVASTATIRRAKEQCSALYNREVSQFPHPGLDAEDSFFARESIINYDHKIYGRKYVGLMPSGKTKAMMEVRSIAALMQEINTMDLPDDIKDKFWTLTVYFNSLKDLGKCSTLVDDDVKDFIKRTAYRLGSAKDARMIARADELTSRVNTTQLNETLDKLEKLCYSKENIENKRYPSNILLATNMISVGIDVARLNVMLLVGQPKLTSEYIQASSRVGRSFPGVAFALYDGSKSRDRSHYEQFKPYHESFYKHVEPTGATPFSKPARDRALHAVIIAMVRVLEDELSAEKGAAKFNRKDYAARIAELKKYITERASDISKRMNTEMVDDSSEIALEIDSVFEKWEQLAENFDEEHFYYGEKFLIKEPDDGEGRLMKPFNTSRNDPAFDTMTSMRNVDSTVAGNVLIWEEV